MGTHWLSCTRQIRCVLLMRKNELLRTAHDIEREVERGLRAVGEIIVSVMNGARHYVQRL